MLKPKLRRIALRLMIMSVFVVCILLSVASDKTPQIVHAARCCEKCLENQQICMQPDHGGYSSYLECANAYQVHQCLVSCTFCD